MCCLTPARQVSAVPSRRQKDLRHLLTHFGSRGITWVGAARIRRLPAGPRQCRRREAPPRYGGEGEPVVLLHGHPRTHTTWHRVARQLSGSFFVVCPDLRGYGRSTLPPDEPGHLQSSKRAMAGDVVAVMRHLGHDRFSVVGHDRGALVAFRTAMDHPDAVHRLVIMDGLPVIEHLERLNEAFVRTWWHWWFLGQTDKPAEAFISADPGNWYRTRHQRRWDQPTTPTCGPPSTIQPSSTACARTTAPACASTAPMRKPTGKQAGRSPSRRSTGRTRRGAPRVPVPEELGAWTGRRQQPQAVRELIADATRVADWSPETASAEWTGDPAAARQPPASRVRTRWARGNGDRIASSRHARRGNALHSKPMPDRSKWRMSL
jgi:pimeloyl-ACP methyl ester carboxylesterase